MSNDSDATIRFREGAAAWRVVEGETILLDLESSRYLGVNRSGTILWSMIVEGSDKPSMVARLQSEYGISEEDAAAGVDAFLGRLPRAQSSRAVTGGPSDAEQGEEASYRRYLAEPLSARFAPSALRAAWWTVFAVRRVRKALKREGLRAVVMPPPRLPTGARRGVNAVLRRQSPTCLERAMVLQCWLAAHGVRTDVVVGVNRREAGVDAHAWLGVEPTPSGEDAFFELHRVPAR